MIKDKTGKEIAEINVLKNYFGLRPQQTVANFLAEVKALSPEDKAELVAGAAHELGYTMS